MWGWILALGAAAGAYHYRADIEKWAAGLGGKGGSAAPSPSPGPTPGGGGQVPPGGNITPPSGYSGPMPPFDLSYPGPGAYSSSASYVAQYQGALTYLAAADSKPQYDPGGVDGKYGPHTIAAVKAFQVDHGLTVDGEAGAQTASALEAAVGMAASTSGAI